MRTHFRLRCGFLAAVAMLVGVVAPAVPASATPSWSVVPSASPAAPPHAQLYGMSCPTTTSCFAVGTTYSQRLIERWNGTAWSLFPPPPGEQYISAQLLSVSCVSASECFAVGSTAGGAIAGIHTRVEHWNGTAWTNTSTSASTLPQTSVLRGVSCVSATFCVVVGDEDLSGGVKRGYIADWDGSQWSVVATPGGSLRGVSCSATNFCVAVGFDPNSHVTAGFRWNGTAWTTMATLNPSGTSQDSLQAVVCRSTTFCVAVGQADSRTLIERWNGTTWSVMPSPNAANFATNQLFGVSCPSATRCFATGARDKRTLIAQWDGTTWSLDANPPFRTGSLVSVSCASTERCAAAGANTSGVQDSSTGIEQFDGTSWTVAPPPAGSSYSALAAVGCAGGTVCFAVGSASSTTTGTLSTLAERWNGTAWVTTPTPSPSDGAVLADVGCGTTTSCIAVGTTSRDTSYATKAVIEHWDGSNWTMTPYPVPPNTTSSTLTSVSCTSATFCMAVGTVTTFDNTHVDTPLIERWNGSTWSLVTPAATSGGTAGSLQSVSCTSSAFCLALSRGGGLAERWNGTTWIQVPPTGVGAQTTIFGEVSCVSGTMCFAVGGGSADPNGAVAVRWNGSTWSITPTASIPNPGAFNGVKCLSGTNCYAVGRVGNPATTLIEHWDGANWALVSSPNPTGSFSSRLNDVACPSATTCHAVGDFARRTDGAINYTLAERLQ